MLKQQHYTLEVEKVEKHSRSSLRGSLIDITIFHAGKCALCIHVPSDSQDAVMVPRPHYERGIPQDDYAAGPS